MSGRCGRGYDTSSPFILGASFHLSGHVYILGTAAGLLHTQIAGQTAVEWRGPAKFPSPTRLFLERKNKRAAAAAAIGVAVAVAVWLDLAFVLCDQNPGVLLQPTCSERQVVDWRAGLR